MIDNRLGHGHVKVLNVGRDTGRDHRFPLFEPGADIGVWIFDGGKIG
jgi:hypothetical protein